MRVREGDDVMTPLEDGTCCRREWSAGSVDHGFLTSSHTENYICVIHFRVPIKGLVKKRKTKNDSISFIVYNYGNKKGFGDDRK